MLSIPLLHLRRRETSKLSFLGKLKSWRNGEKIHAARLVGGKTHKKFVLKYVEKTVGSYRKYWRQQLFSGTGVPPKGFSSEIELVDFVKKMKGAIGYISNGTPHEGVTVINTQ